MLRGSPMATQLATPLQMLLLLQSVITSSNHLIIAIVSSSTIIITNQPFCGDNNVSRAWLCESSFLMILCSHVWMNWPITVNFVSHLALFLHDHQLARSGQELEMQGSGSRLIRTFEKRFPAKVSHWHLVLPGSIAFGAVWTGSKPESSFTLAN